ncbi:venom serine carboxypeptidase-like [Bacillus rossius redtenbacheri]|uniref:venom serine carboxypeptidase-like n=1 Tax=Bacillus rossius redtenbacheri TaxID=93214 RepID=UPI002FDE1C5B
MVLFNFKWAGVLSLIILQLIQGCVSMIDVYPRVRSVPVTGDPGQPLFLTPLIESGNITAAKAAARVGRLEGAEGIESYSGYLTVNKNLNSNLFFWFFPAEVKAATAPVLLWLQGGPGASSLFGLFGENGPFYVSKRNTLKRRKYAWTSSNSVIYIDNPVGTGFSFTESDDGYARNETAVGEDLYCALQQFFRLFPELQKNDFYITGESYAGKYIPALGYAIHTKNPNATLKINMQGMAIGNGLSDPENMLLYGDYLYQLGLIDLNARDLFHQKEALTRKYIQARQWKKAFQVFDTLLNGDLSQNGTLFSNLTGLKSYYNYVSADGRRRGGDSDLYVQGAAVRRALHVGGRPYNDGRAVERHLEEDVMRSVRPWVEELLEHHRIVTYNGQLDVIVAYPLTLGYLQALRWSASPAYRTAPRYQWHVGRELAGYVKHAGHLTEVLVRDAGHMVPADQPRWALDLITRFTSEKAFAP